jgi:hypothetical protein
MEIFSTKCTIQEFYAGNIFKYIRFDTRINYYISRNCFSYFFLHACSRRGGLGSRSIMQKPDPYNFSFPNRKPRYSSSSLTNDDVLKMASFFFTQWEVGVDYDEVLASHRRLSRAQCCTPAALPHCTPK